MVTRLLPLLLLLGGCTTVQSYATCDNARIAAEVAQRAVARICPIQP
jgi:hypothetical protein